MAVGHISSHAPALCSVYIYPTLIFKYNVSKFIQVVVIGLILLRTIHFEAFSCVNGKALERIRTSSIRTQSGCSGFIPYLDMLLANIYLGSRQIRFTNRPNICTYMCMGNVACSCS